MSESENSSNVQRSLGRIEGGIIEIKADIGLMRTDHALLQAEFQALEAGRLTKLESAFALSQAEIKRHAKNTALIWASGVAIVISVITAMIIKFLDL